MDTPHIVLDLPPKKMGLKLFYGIEELEAVEREHGGEPISSLCSEDRMGVAVIITLVWAGTKLFNPRNRAAVASELQAYLNAGGSLKTVALQLTEALSQSRTIQSLKKDAEANPAGE